MLVNSRTLRGCAVKPVRLRGPSTRPLQRDSMAAPPRRSRARALLPSNLIRCLAAPAVATLAAKLGSLTRRVGLAWVVLLTFCGASMLVSLVVVMAKIFGLTPAVFTKFEYAAVKMGFVTSIGVLCLGVLWVFKPQPSLSTQMAMLSAQRQKELREGLRTDVEKLSSQQEWP